MVFVDKSNTTIDSKLNGTFALVQSLFALKFDKSELVYVYEELVDDHNNPKQYLTSL